MCLTGRFIGIARPAFTFAVSGSAVAAAVATGDAVRDVGTAIMPIIVIAIIGLGFLARRSAAMLMGGLVIACDTLVPAVVRPHAAGDLLIQTAIQTLILVSGIAGGHVARRFVTTEERALDELAVAVGADRAASAARVARRELERELHDTVLSTLSALGRESLRDSDAVRHRCAADARFLRTHGQSAGPSAVALEDRLASVIGPFIAAGFPVELSGDHRANVPDGVAEAMARATREALNNAHRHSGAGCARVEVDARAGGLTVRAVDSGVGVRVDAPNSLGTRRSLIERLADVGGRATVTRSPGAGTTVTLRWPR